MCTSGKQIMGWTLEFIQKQEVANPPSNGFMKAVLSKGGAEGWVQVELLNIYDTLPNTLWVQREQCVYKDQAKKCDLLISCKDKTFTCIELKVESLFQSADMGRATMPHTQWKEVLADVIKLQSERTGDYAKYQAYAVAIVWSKEAINGMDSWLSSSSLNYEREQYETSEQEIKHPVTVYVISV